MDSIKVNTENIGSIVIESNLAWNKFQNSEIIVLYNKKAI